MDSGVVILRIALSFFPEYSYRLRPSARAKRTLWAILFTEGRHPQRDALTK